MNWRFWRAFVPRSLLFAIALTVLSACGVVETGPNYRYRLTIEIETPQGLRTGSSVIAVKCGIVRLSAMGGSGCHARGEAVTVDMPDGQTLFALLRGKDDPDLANYLASSPVMPRSAKADSHDRDEQWRRRAEFLAQPRQIPRTVKGGPSGRESVDNYPMMILFEDNKDPAGVKIVEPDRLELGFGYPASINSITVQLTEAPVTRRLHNKISWINGSMIKDQSYWQKLPYESRIAISGLQRGMKGI
ncbi:hypothetical protein [Sphingopyxis kveilinensis]|uniref:hypothetical protein n=1 Tax=Sphingopyxis kveilinensis TaxID=3114367 RepID=UPI0030CE0E3B